MTRKKRHTNAEIAAMLAQADALAAQGKLQPEIANTLGISVMTLHRWRKAQLTIAPSPLETGHSAYPGGEDRIAELQLENSRLRKLVTDLLLEKVKLEEAATQKFRRRV